MVGRILLLLVTVLIAGSGLLPDAALEALRFERAAIAAGQWWRLATAHVVHLGAGHALMNAAALVLIVWLARDLRRSGEWLWLALASVIAVDAGLYLLVPALSWYVGASGVLHGLFSGAALLTLLRGDRLQGAVMLAAVGVKVGWEWAAGGSVSTLAGAGFPVVTESHLLGACGGAVGALLLRGLQATLGRGGAPRRP